MNFNLLLQNNNLNQQTSDIVEWVGNNQNHFDYLFKAFLSDSNNRMIQRIASPITLIAINHPQLIRKHFSSIIERVADAAQPVAIRRNLLRMIDQITNIPTKYHGTIMDTCFLYISDPREAIAIQAYSLGILNKLANLYPEILPELKAIVEAMLPNSSAAYLSRAKKILNRRQ